jgi:hypothetical protein
VVKIASKDFNKELMGYIGKRKSGQGILSRLKKISESKPAEKPKTVGPMQVEVEYKKQGLLSKLFYFRRRLIKEAEKSEDLTPEEMAKLHGMEDDIEDTEKEIVEKEDEVKEIKRQEEKLVEKRENMLTKFFDKVNVFKRKPMANVEAQPEAYEKEEPVLDQEVIEVIKIAHKWLGELTPGKKRSFKASADFQKYKEVLEKYGLVKEKKE